MINLDNNCCLLCLKNKKINGENICTVTQEIILKDEEEIKCCENFDELDWI